MNPVHGEPSMQGDHVRMHRNGAIKVAFDNANDVRTVFIVRGKGTPVTGAYPRIAVDVNGERVGTLVMADEDWGEYCLVTRLDLGRHEVVLSFINDAWDPETGEDRNVVLDWLRIGRARRSRRTPSLDPPAFVDVHDGPHVDQIRWDKRPGHPKANRYLIDLLMNFGCEFRSAVDGVTFPASALRPAPGTKLWRLRDDALSLATNGTVTTRVRFAKARRHEFAIRAWGTAAAGEFPKIALSIDGREVGEATLRRAGWHTVRLEAQVAAGEHEVGLSFTNDLYNPPEDRNLRIRELHVR
jgi:hypothetical protein